MSNLWKNFGPHTIAVLALALPYVVQYAPAIPGWGLIAASVAGGLLTVVHALQQPASSTVVASATKAVPALLGLMLGLSGLAGCASFNAVVNQTSTTQTLIQDGVKAGVMASILTQPASGQKSTAQGIIAAAQAIEGVAADSQLTLSQLNVVIAQRLAQTKLDPLVQSVIGDAISAVVNELSQKIATKVLTADSQTSVNTIMGWIIAGATPYAGN